MSSDNGRAPHLSVVIPAYNERDKIAASIKEVESYLESQGIDYEVIVVDDGSRDGTAREVQRAANGSKRVRLISYPENRGKGHAVRLGILSSSGRCVMFTDADLSIPVSISTDFIRAVENGYDIAIASRWLPGSRATGSPRVYRRIMGQVFRLLVHLLVTRGVSDTQCGCKCYTRAAADKLYSIQRIDSFSFDAEVLYLAKRHRFSIKEVPFHLAHSHESTVHPFLDPIRMVWDLVRIRARALLGRYG